MATRDDRAAEARKAGDRELATGIKKLRRPTTSAWLVNLLVQAHRDLVGELLDLGPALSHAKPNTPGTSCDDSPNGGGNWFRRCGTKRNVWLVTRAKRSATAFKTRWRAPWKPRWLIRRSLTCSAWVV